MTILLPKRVLLPVQDTHPIHISALISRMPNLRARHPRLPIQRPHQIPTRATIQLHLLIIPMSVAAHPLFLDAHLHLLTDALTEVLIRTAVSGHVGDGVLREGCSLLAEHAAAAGVAYVVETDGAWLRVGRALGRAIAAGPAFGEVRGEGADNGGEGAAEEGEDHGEVGGNDGDEGLTTRPVSCLLSSSKGVLKMVSNMVHSSTPQSTYCDNQNTAQNTSHSDKDSS